MTSLFCPVCNTENPTTRQFCRKCASDLRAPVAVPSATPTHAKEPTPIRPIAIGGGIALVVVVIAIGLIVALGGSPAASPSPLPSASPTATAAATATPVPTPTAAPIVTKAPTAAPTAAGTPAPGTKPTIDKFTGPRTASCTEPNGVAPAGWIHLSWTASNATGVRLSIDPPSAKTAYDAGYEDYPAVGSADVPFGCDPPKSDASGPYHLYVVTTLHDTGYYSYRFIKVYLKT